MEKFRKFADHSTGINPFVNPAGVGNKPITERLKTLFLSSMIFLIKFPFFLLLVLFAACLSYLLLPLVFLPGIKRYIVLLTNHLLYRAILYLLGVYSIDGMQKRVPKMGSGHLILALNTSPLDIYLLKYLASPVFAEAAVDGDGNLAVFRKSNRSLWNILSDPLSLALREKESNFKGESLEKLVDSAKKGILGPVVLFFEGARTNGTGVLEIDKAVMGELKKFSLNNEIVAFSSEYQNNSFDRSPINVPTNGVKKTLELLSGPSNKVKVKLAALEKGENFENSLKNFYVSSKRPQLKVGWRDFRDFLEYFQKTQRRNYAKETLGKKE